MFFFELLYKFNLIKEVPPWFSNIDVKSSYLSEDYAAYWNIPEFSGKDGESIRNCATPDGKLIMKKEKKIFLIEMTVPWITNREEKQKMKAAKYMEIQDYLTLENPSYKVDQITLVMDVFGGFSKDLIDNVAKVFEKEGTKRIIQNMQK